MVVRIQLIDILEKRELGASKRGKRGRKGIHKEGESINTGKEWICEREIKGEGK